ncbi:MAG: DUF2254 domain-containing protein [Pseudomonas sp.]
MISKWQWLLAQLTRMLWVRASFFALLAVAAALLALAAEQVLPEGMPISIGADSVETILNILASSMLAVTTFSLTVMVSAYAAATSSVTPRATRLLMQDTTTQNVLGTFIGSFLFSLVGIIVLSTEAYGERGRVVLFGFTVLVVLIIVITILRWIEHLSVFGRVGDTTSRVELCVSQVLTERRRHPGLGGTPVAPVLPDMSDEAHPVKANWAGYVQHLDVEALSACAQKHEWRIWVACLPGSFVTPGQTLAWLEGQVATDAQEAAKAFTLGVERSFDQDPRFGLSVLAEIASRALSPAVNDPGTAIDVIGRGVRLLGEYSSGDTDEAEQLIRCPRVMVPSLDLADLFADLFAPIARDGAGLIEVQMRLGKGLLALAEQSEAAAEPAREQLQRALLLAEQALPLEQDRARLRKLTS